MTNLMSTYKQNLETILHDNLQTLQIHSQNIDSKLIMMILKNFPMIKLDRVNNNLIYKLPFIYQYYSKNSVLYHEGSPSTKIYFLLKGNVSLYMPKSYQELQMCQNQQQCKKCNYKSDNVDTSTNNLPEKRLANKWDNKYNTYSPNKPKHKSSLSQDQHYPSHHHHQQLHQHHLQQYELQQTHNLDLSSSISDTDNNDRSEHELPNIPTNNALNNMELVYSSPSSSSMVGIDMSKNNQQNVNNVLPNLKQKSPTTSNNNNTNTLKFENKSTTTHNNNLDNNDDNNNDDDNDHDQSKHDYKLFSLLIDRKGKYILKNGLLSIRYFKSVYPGECIGLLTSILGVTRNHTSIAIEDTHVISIERDDFINHFNEIVYKIREQFHFYTLFYESKSSYFELLKFFHGLKEIEYMSNDVVYKEEDSAAGMYVIIKGEIKIQKRNQMRNFNSRYLQDSRLLENGCNNDNDNVEEDYKNVDNAEGLNTAIALTKYQIFGEEMLLNYKYRRYTAISTSSCTLVHYIDPVYFLRIKKLCPNLYSYLKYQAKIDHNRYIEFFDYAQHHHYQATSTSSNGNTSGLNNTSPTTSTMMNKHKTITLHDTNTMRYSLAPLAINNTTSLDKINEYGPGSPSKGTLGKSISPVKGSNHTITSILSSLQRKDQTLKKKQNSLQINEYGKGDLSYRTPKSLRGGGLLDSRTPKNLIGFEDEDAMMMMIANEDNKAIMKELNSSVGVKKVRERGFDGSLLLNSNIKNSQPSDQTLILNQGKSKQYRPIFKSFASTMNSNYDSLTNIESNMNFESTQKIQSNNRHNSDGLAFEQNESPMNNNNKHYAQRSRLLQPVSYSDHLRELNRKSTHHPSMIDSLNMSDFQFGDAILPYNPQYHKGSSSLLEYITTSNSSNNSPKKVIYIKQKSNSRRLDQRSSSLPQPQQIHQSQQADQSQQAQQIHQTQQIHQPQQQQQQQSNQSQQAHQSQQVQQVHQSQQANQSQQVHQSQQAHQTQPVQLYQSQQGQLNEARQPQQAQPRHHHHKQQYPDIEMTNFSRTSYIQSPIRSKIQRLEEFSVGIGDGQSRLLNECMKNKTQVIRSKHNQFRLKPKNVRLLERYPIQKFSLSLGNTTTIIMATNANVNANANATITTTSNNTFVKEPKESNETEISLDDD